MKKGKIPQPTIERLPIYYRCLLQLREEGMNRVSSEELGRRITINSAQIRKDLTYFGQFGRRGIGYEIESLIKDIAFILGLTKAKKMAVIGVGNLGRALICYNGFRDKHFNIVAAFDSDPKKIGQSMGETEVYDLKVLDKLVAEKGIEVGIVTVPAEDAQNVVDLLIGAGVQGILNFAPTKVVVPEKVKLRDVDLGVEILRLSYHLVNR